MSCIQQDVPSLKFWIIITKQSYKSSYIQPDVPS